MCFITFEQSQSFLLLLNKTGTYSDLISINKRVEDVHAEDKCFDSFETVDEFAMWWKFW